MTTRTITFGQNVPILRTDHISTTSSLPGVWRGQRLTAASVTVEKEMAAVLAILLVVPN
jgi:hypothetical protein